VSAFPTQDGEQDEFATPEMAAARAAFYGEGGIASCQRVVHSAVPDRQIQVLENMTRDALILAERAGLDPIETIDSMSNTADAAGITARHGQDEVQAALGRAAVAAKPSAVPDAIEEVDICSPQRAGLEVVCLADVTPRRIDWLWLNWIAIGKVSVLAGDGGKGKSTILCDWAARTTNGARWPDGAEATPAGGVLILAAEDDIEDTIAPRLIAAGANLRRVFTIRSVRNEDKHKTRRSFNLQADLAKLEDEIRARDNIRLVIIDPVSSYLGKVDSHKNADVRAVLEPLAEMAARMRVAVICNNHFSKNGGNANNRIIGSVAFVNQARAAFIVTPDAEDETRLLLMPSKMNIVPIKHGLAYRIEGRHIEAGGEEIFTSSILWESKPVTITADEALAAHSEGDEVKTAKAEAAEFLKSTLANGPRSVADIQREARAAGISPKSLRSAREALGVRPDKSGFDGGWVWSLPGALKMPNGPQDAHVLERASSSPGGHLRENEAPIVPPVEDYPELPANLRRTMGSA
jgi:AAA domain